MPSEHPDKTQDGLSEARRESLKRLAVMVKDWTATNPHQEAQAAVADDWRKLEDGLRKFTKSYLSDPENHKNRWELAARWRSCFAKLPTINTRPDLAGEMSPWELMDYDVEIDKPDFWDFARQIVRDELLEPAETGAERRREYWRQVKAQEAAEQERIEQEARDQREEQREAAFQEKQAKKREAERLETAKEVRARKRRKWLARRNAEPPKRMPKQQESSGNKLYVAVALDEMESQASDVEFAMAHGLKLAQVMTAGQPCGMTPTQWAISSPATVSVKSCGRVISGYRMRGGKRISLPPPILFARNDDAAWRVIYPTAVAARRGYTKIPIPDISLRPRQWRVWCAIYHVSRSTGMLWASCDSLGKLSGGKHRKTVNDILLELLQLGLITVLEQTSKATKYRVTVRHQDKARGTNRGIRGTNRPIRKAES